MGSRWLGELADICRYVGLEVREVPGWQARGRSSGGLDDLRGFIWHHMASSPASDGQADADFLATRSSVAPVSQLSIARTGVVWVVAAGACNHGGKGGPVGDWLPADRANTLTMGIEMANRGDGVEVWPMVQIDASIVLAGALHSFYGLPLERSIGHKEYCGPGSTTPGRKIDPFGPWANGQSWGAPQGRIDEWRHYVGLRLAPTEPAPPPVPAFSHGTVRRGDVGDGVFAAQVIVRHRAGQAGPCDGVFGEQLDAAVRNVQAFTGQPVDGIIGPRTWEVLDLLANS